MVLPFKVLQKNDHRVGKLGVITIVRDSYYVILRIMPVQRTTFRFS